MTPTATCGASPGNASTRSSSMRSHQSRSLGALLEIWAQLHVEVRRLIVERATSGGEAWLEPALLNGAADSDRLVRTTARQALVRKERFDLFPEASLLDLFRESFEGDSWTD